MREPPRARTLAIVHDRLCYQKHRYWPLPTSYGGHEQLIRNDQVPFTRLIAPHSREQLYNCKQRTCTILRASSILSSANCWLNASKENTVSAGRSFCSATGMLFSPFCFVW